MAYELQLDETVEDGLRRIAVELIDDSIGWLDRSDRAPDAAVHEVRKDCKKLRGLLRLVRPAAPALYRAENRIFRDAARPLKAMHH